MPRTRGVRLLAASGLLAASAIGGATGAAPHVAAIAPHPFIQDVGTLTFPPTTAQCLTLFKRHCYQPFQLEKAYRLTALHNAGIDGRGTTILIVDSFGSPTITGDLKAFDKQFGLPDPPSFEIRHDAGAPPPFDPTNADMVGWAAETTLDVEWSHVFAPGAKIVLEETPVAETEGVQGFPEIVTVENYAIDHGIGDVISQSFGATEETFPNKKALLNLRGSFKNAARHHVTLLGSSGDNGATSQQLNGTDLYTTQVNSWPSSDPLVTSMGGTQLLLDATGKRLGPDVGWSGSGGGFSHVFERPDFQDRVENVVGDQRGTPDISLSSACDGAVVYYRSFGGRSASPWGLVCGTSEASPEFAGIVAMANQIAGHRLGNINKALYHMKYGKDGLVDVTSGNNSATFTNSDGKTYTVQGFNAGPGYDLVTGLGTVDASKFVPALARAAGDEGGDGGGGDS